MTKSRSGYHDVNVLLLAGFLLITTPLHSNAFSLQSPPTTATRLTPTRMPFALSRSPKSTIKIVTITQKTLEKNLVPLWSTEDDGDVGASSKDESGNKLSQIKKKLGSYFKSSEKDDGLTFRQRLAKMGLATVLSYGWISNTNAMILVAAAWYVFSAKAKMSPLYPGQWKNFLGVYAGFYVISNFLRPFRVTLAIAIGPYFDRLVNWIARKTKLPKAGAITVTVLIVNLCGTLLLMVGGISLASLLSGVPIFPPKV